MKAAFFKTCCECGGDDPGFDGICPLCRDQYPINDNTPCGDEEGRDGE
jgi:hypothetical protein